jgi:hypothetical protein
MGKPKKLLNVTELVDRIGCIKANIADLKAQEKEALEELKEMGIGERQGRLFEANVFTQSRSTTAWKEVVAEAKVPQRIIDKHTKTQDILVCKITARK